MILVLEPDEAVAGQITAALSEARHDAVVFASADEALAWVRENGPPDVMVVDTSPRDMSRLAFVAAVRVHTRTHVPVVYVSRKKLRDLGAEEDTRIFAAPLDAHAFLAEVRRQLEESASSRGTRPGEGNWSAAWDADESEA